MSAAQDAVPQKATPPKDTQHDDDETTQPQQQLADILAARRLLAALCIWKESPDSNSSHDATLQQLAQDIAGLLHDLHSHSANDEWTQVNNTQHLRAWYKQAQQEGKQEAKQIHSILVHMVFPKARIDKPLTMGWEFDLVQTWNSYATATHILKVSGYTSCASWISIVGVCIMDQHCWGVHMGVFLTCFAHHHRHTVIMKYWHTALCGCHTPLHNPMRCVFE